MSLDSSAERAHRMGTADFEDALGKAEMLLDDADRGRDRTRYIRAGQASGTAIVGVALAITAGTSRISAITVSVISVVCAIILVLLVSWAEIALIMPVKRQVSRDERAMLEIIGLLRELLASVADNETWSSSRQRLVRARISRFPIATRNKR